MHVARILIALACVLLGVGLPARALGHVPNVASFHLQERDGAWELSVQLSTDRLHRALKHRHPGRAFAEVDVVEYEALLEAMLREGVRIRYDGVAVALEGATVTLAPHASTVRFAVPSLPADVKKVAATIDALDYDGEQQNVFRVVHGRATKHVVLAARNGFRGEIVLQAVAGEAMSPENMSPDNAPDERVRLGSTQAPRASASWIGWVAGLFLAVGCLALRRSTPR